MPCCRTNTTKQNKTKQNKTKQNKTKQNKTKQNKTKQNRTGQDRTGQDRTRQDTSTNMKKDCNIVNLACDVTLSVYPHRAGLKNMQGHGGNRTYDLWNTSPMLCQLSYAVRSVRVCKLEPT